MISKPEQADFEVERAGAGFVQCSKFKVHSLVTRTVVLFFKVNINEL